MKVIDQINALDKPPSWHRWLSIGISMPFRLLLLVLGIPIMLLICIEDEDFRKFPAGVKRILIDKLDMDGGTP